MKRNTLGYTLVEMTTVLAVTSILTASTIPLGAFWLQRNQLIEAEGELAVGIGKAVSSSLRNEFAHDATDPIAAVCISDLNQLTVLEADNSTLPNCSTASGVTIWSASLPENLTITSFDVPVSCFCFDSNARLTANSCNSCLTNATVDLAVGSREDTFHVQ